MCTYYEINCRQLLAYCALCACRRAVALPAPQLHHTPHNSITRGTEPRHAMSIFADILGHAGLRHRDMPPPPCHPLPAPGGTAVAPTPCRRPFSWLGCWTRCVSPGLEYVQTPRQRSSSACEPARAKPCPCQDRHPCDHSNYHSNYHSNGSKPITTLSRMVVMSPMCM